MDPQDLETNEDDHWIEVCFASVMFLFQTLRERIIPVIADKYEFIVRNKSKLKQLLEFLDQQIFDAKTIQIFIIESFASVEHSAEALMKEFKIVVTKKTVWISRWTIVEKISFPECWDNQISEWSLQINDFSIKHSDRSYLCLENSIENLMEETKLVVTEEIEFWYRHMTFLNVVRGAFWPTRFWWKH